METRTHSEALPENLVDKITGMPLKEKFALLQTRVKYGDGPFFQIFLAAETDTARKTVEQLCKTMAVSKENVIPIDFPIDSMDINHILLDLREKISDRFGDLIIILVNGIEHRGKVVQDANPMPSHAVIALDRVIHDYSQEIFDSSSGTALATVYDIGKKVIIITHIGHSEGREMYEAMVRSAIQTRFKDDIFEI